MGFMTVKEGAIFVETAIGPQKITADQAQTIIGQRISGSTQCFVDEVSEGCDNWQLEENARKFYLEVLEINNVVRKLTGRPTEKSLEEINAELQEQVHQLEMKMKRLESVGSKAVQEQPEPAISLAEDSGENGLHVSKQEILKSLGSKTPRARTRRKALIK